MSYTLRALPLPVKVVASVFLLTVGVGYTAALVQLHMQDAKSGKPMPTVEDVILKYTGKKKFDPNAAPAAPVSRLESLVVNPIVTINSGSMSAAFTKDDRAKGDLKFSTLIKGKTPEQVKEIEEQRKGEQTAFKLWINAPEDVRKAAYAADKFVPPAGQAPKALTSAFKDGDAIKIKSIIDNRCVTCHSKGGEKAGIPLDTYDGLAKHISIEVSAPATDDWVKVEEPISLTKLTQSTHAHLLSFAMLFSLTGVIFAFSSYPTSVRCILGPWVVLAVFADVSLWWLARLCDQWGPYFAMGIIATGGAAGLGLGAQIVLSLFNMYGPKGKVVVALLFLLAGAMGWLVIVNKIKPGLDEKANQIAKTEPVKPEDKSDPNKGPTKDDKNDQNPNVKKDAPYRPINDLDRLLTLPVRDANGQPVPPADVQWGGGEKGSMVPAFFEKEKEFKKLMDDPAVPQEVKDKLKAERQAELDAMLAWVRSAEEARKAAYAANAFEVPPAVVGKVTSKFVKDGKVQIKSLIDNRCAACHAPEKKQEDYPLDTFEGLSKYLQPFPPPAAPAPPAKKDGDAIPAPPPAPPAPAPTRTVEPIPDAKDD
jgi:hypothetical protein